MYSIAPYVGYIASLMLVIALLVKNDIKFRWCSTAGNISFIFYGMLIGAVPVLITNAILLAINGFYLVRIYSRHEYFDLIEFSGEEKLITKFTTYYKKDIAAYFPGFNAELLKGNLSFVVLRDLVIANIFCVIMKENGDAEVMINYTLPKYRDYKIGRFIFEKEKQFLVSKGIKRVIYKTVSHPGHLAFIKIMGFSRQADGAGWNYIKIL